ncbi:MAG TPA: type II secretion system protein GspM [Longimicrobium sp.]|nr:type II secretion system protein GspM [Longimicrobium sp.]
MIARMSDRDRRVLVMGAIAIALMLLLTRGLPAWRRWDRDARAAAAEMAAEAARAEAGVRRLPAALDSLQARKARLVALGQSLLDGDTPAAAGATLASLVTGAAARAGVQTGSVQVRPDTTAGATFSRIRVSADGVGDLPAITRMLTLLEGAPELLAVRALAITQPDAGGPADRAESLRVEITVEGLALVRVKRAEAAR